MRLYMPHALNGKLTQEIQLNGLESQDVFGTLLKSVVQHHQIGHIKNFRDN